MEKLIKKAIFKIKKKNRKPIFSPMKYRSPLLRYSCSSRKISRVSPFQPEYILSNNQISFIDPIYLAQNESAINPFSSNIPLDFKEEDTISPSTQDKVSLESSINYFQKRGIEILKRKLILEFCDKEQICINPKFFLKMDSPDPLNFMCEDRSRTKATCVNEALLQENPEKEVIKTRICLDIEVKCKCGLIFKNSKALGGHMGRKHPGESEKYKKKRKICIARAPVRERYHIAKNGLFYELYHINLHEIKNPQMKKVYNKSLAKNKTTLKKTRNLLTNAEIEEGRKQIDLHKKRRKL